MSVLGEDYIHVKRVIYVDDFGQRNALANGAHINRSAIVYPRAQ